MAEHMHIACPRTGCRVLNEVPDSSTLTLNTARTLPILSLQRSQVVMHWAHKYSELGRTCADRAADARARQCVCRHTGEDSRLCLSDCRPQLSRCTQVQMSLCYPLATLLLPSCHPDGCKLLAGSLQAKGPPSSIPDQGTSPNLQDPRCTTGVAGTLMTNLQPTGEPSIVHTAAHSKATS